MGGTANLTRNTADFGNSLRTVLEALEEQVVVLRLLAAQQEAGKGNGAHRPRDRGRGDGRNVGGHHHLRQLRDGLRRHGRGGSDPDGLSRDDGQRRRGGDVHRRGARPPHRLTTGVGGNFRKEALRKRSGVARDYYGLLGWAGTPAMRISNGPTAGWPVNCTRRQSRRGGPAPVQGDHHRLRGALGSGEAPHRRSRRRPAGQRRSRQRFAGFGGLGDVFEAFFGGGRLRGPIGRVRPGSDSLLRMRLTLADCATGVTKQVTVDTAVLCELCQGRAPTVTPGRRSATPAAAAGRSRASSARYSARSLTSRACPTCAGVGEVIPNPCHSCGGDGRVRSRRGSA